VQAQSLPSLGTYEKVDPTAIIDALSQARQRLGGKGWRANAKDIFKRYFPFCICLQVFYLSGTQLF
jgi:hypothetical protein